MKRATLLLQVAALWCSAAFAYLNVTPTLLNTGVSNITTAFTISGSGAWEATAYYGANPVWFVLSVHSGTVSETAPVSVPVTIYRGALPSVGTYTGTVLVCDGMTPVVLTLVTTLSADNCGILARISGEDHAYAGIPYTLDGRGTLGKVDCFSWVANWNRRTSMHVYTNVIDRHTWYTPQSFTLTLVAMDRYERHSTDHIFGFKVWNSHPTVDAGGPYDSSAGTSMTVVAVGADPNPNEELEYRWQFQPPDGQWTSWTSSPTATHTYTVWHEGIIVCEVRDTWPGEPGEYNGPLTSRGVAQVFADSTPPSVEVAYRSNGVWSSWARRHEVAVPIMKTNVTIKANPIDPDGEPGPLTVEWREYAGNPARGLIAAADKTNIQVTTAEFPMPGLYRFRVVANDGRYVSDTAEVRVRVPGIVGSVVAHGFQARLPVWGAHCSADARNTNALGEHLGIGDTTSDMNGTAFFDLPCNAQCFLQLERSPQEGEIRDYAFRTAFASNFNGVQVLPFPVKTYAYGGRLVDAHDASQGVAYANATLVMHGAGISVKCNEAGGYSFGNLPKAWPTDSEETGSYYIVFTKAGWTSLCLKKTPAQVNTSALNDVWSIVNTNATITLSGSVQSSVSGLPVGGARVWFGVVSTVADGNGEFTFPPLPLPCPAHEGPTHVLVAKANGYTTTRNVYTATGDGGSVDVFIDGGDKYVYGTVYDSWSGDIVTNGTVSTPTAAFRSKGQMNGEFISRSVDIEPSGHFTIRIPGGVDYVTIDACDKSIDVGVERATTGNQVLGCDVDIVPEPALAVWFVGTGLAVGWIRRRALGFAKRDGWRAA